MTKISLRLRTLFFIGVTLLTLFAALYPISSRVWLAGYISLEEKYMQADLSRLRAMLDEQLARLKSWVQDYAWWDETYEFVLKPNQAYQEAYLTAKNLKNLDLDLIILLNSDGTAVFAGLLESSDNQISPLSTDLISQIHAYLGLRKLAGPEDTLSGLILLEGTPLMLAVAPVLTNAHTGPSPGVLIMGRRLNEQRVKQLSTLVKIPLSLAPVAMAFAEGLSSQIPELVLVNDERYLHGYSLLKDLNAQPIATLKLEGERWIYQQGRKSQRYLLISLIIVGLICTVTVLWLLERLILGRLARFNKSLAISSPTQEATLRLPSKEGDELDALTVTINGMLDSLKKTHEQLLHDALHDQLTGLANRVLFMDRLQKAMHQTARNPQQGFAVLLLDLDGFKHINDSLGHNIGDQILVTVARRMECCVRSGDTVARLGGDEFVLMVTSIEEVTDAFRIAERLLQDLCGPIQWNEYTLPISASIGIVVYSASYQTADQMLMDADIAMYRAKQKGRNCYELFNRSMHIQVQARLELENDLRLAIQRNELRAYYQPIVSLRSGEIVSFEALVRWQHPQRGLVSPLEFIPIAEEIGMIAAIDRWMVAEACRCLSRWRERFVKVPQSVSVNLSCTHLRTANFVRQVLEILAGNGLSGGELHLEITESIFGSDDKELFCRVLNELAVTGVQLLLDDFGTGYSSLSRLHELPIHILKIDRSFMAHLVGTNAKVVEAIITLAHNMDKQVVAEGIETREQMRQLAELGCEYGQGYYFSRPLPEQEASKLIAGQLSWEKDFAVPMSLELSQFAAKGLGLDRLRSQ